MTTVAVLAVALLAWALGAAHSWLGETRLIRPLLSQPTGMLARSRFAGSTLRWAWHLTTLAWCGLGTILAALALSPPGFQIRAALMAIAATFLATAVVIALSSRWKHFAWPIFVAMAALSLAPLV